MPIFALQQVIAVFPGAVFYLLFTFFPLTVLLE